ncbi:hypothetical protein SDC9_90157 [bioreactor metagenome]|uniref:Uncharacterized protein n=1 Tax=bioreactor metagenome TaxID=1076179 RepID=A0A644ZRK4_9ZZZZ
MHRVPARQHGLRRPQRVIRGGNEDLVADIGHGLQNHGNQFADTIADQYLRDIDVQPAGLVVVRNRGARRIDATRIGIAIGFMKMGDERAHHRFGRCESEAGEIADVEVQHPLALSLHALSLNHVLSAHVVVHTLQSARLFVFRHLSPFHLVRPRDRAWQLAEPLSKYRRSRQRNRNSAPTGQDTRVWSGGGCE